MHGTRWRKFAAFFLAAGLLPGACTYYPFGEPQPVPVQEPPPPSRPTHVAHHAPVRPAQPAQVVARRDNQIEHADQAIAHVVGLSEPQVQARLGSPAQREERRPGTAWIYREADCRLEVSFYPDVQTHAYKALGYEVKSNAGTNDGNHRCAARFAARIAAK